MTNACTPEVEVPSLEAINTGLAQLAHEAKDLSAEQERLLVKQRMFMVKVKICVEALQAHIPAGTQTAPSRHFPELNHIGE